jgi:hypothetical protein
VVLVSISSECKLEKLVKTRRVEQVGEALQLRRQLVRQKKIRQLRRRRRRVSTRKRARSSSKRALTAHSGAASMRAVVSAKNTRLARGGHDATLRAAQHVSHI